jgi:hypothetical protein
MVPGHVGLINEPFVPHNLISTQESPVPLLKFQMVPRLKNLMAPKSERNPDILLFFSLRSPSKRTPSRFPNRAPMKREAHLQGILHISQKPHLSGSPVKVPSPKVPFMKSLAERCPNTTALLHSSIKVPGIQPPPTYQIPLEWKGPTIEFHSYHSRRLQAGSTVLTVLPICCESESMHFSSMYYS